MIGSRAGVVGAMVTTAVLMAVGAAPALAEEDATETVAQQASAVAPYIGEVTPASIDSGDVVAAGDQIELVAGSELGEGVEIAGPEGTAPLTVQIGFGADDAAAEVASDGSVVYSSGTGEDVVVQATNDAVRIQTVIASSQDSHEIPYTFGEGFLPGSDGINFFVADIRNPEGATVYSVEQPWAFDATGTAVDTRFEIRDETLVQVITPNAETVYPVVADPTMKWVAGGFGAQMTRAETREIAAGSAGAGMCAAFVKKIPGSWKIAGATACGVLASYMFNRAQVARERNSCIFVQFVPAPAVWIGCS